MPDQSWRTYSIPFARSLDKSWKKQSGVACPHGLRIFLVDGTHVRNKYDSDFSQGGNGFAYNFVPKNEIWIDAQISDEEWPFIAFHECNEVELMRKGLDYDRAHEIVKRREDHLRQRGHHDAEETT